MKCIFVTSSLACTAQLVLMKIHICEVMQSKFLYYLLIGKTYFTSFGLTLLWWLLLWLPLLRLLLLLLMLLLVDDHVEPGGVIPGKVLDVNAGVLAAQDHVVAASRVGRGARPVRVKGPEPVIRDVSGRMPLRPGLLQDELRVLVLAHGVVDRLAILRKLSTLEFKGAIVVSTSVILLRSMG